jgi:hypothetical protein
MRALFVVLTLAIAAPLAAQDTWERQPSFDGYDFEAPVEPEHPLHAEVEDVDAHIHRSWHLIVGSRSNFLAELLRSLAYR